MNIAFFKSKQNGYGLRKRSWSNQDIADFYRAVDLMKQAGLHVEVDSGVTDEGDPWFVFIRPDSGDVVAHFAHVDGQFLAVSSLNSQVFRGEDIRQIVNRMLDHHPLVVPRNPSGAKLFVHPAAALTTFLAAAFVLTIEGVKANSLQEVLVSVTKGVMPILEHDPSLIMEQARAESSKTMLTDVSVSNYSVAILGAALIAHELADNELENNLWLQLDSLPRLADDKEVKGNLETDLIVVSQNLPDTHALENTDSVEPQIEASNPAGENGTVEVLQKKSKINFKADEKAAEGSQRVTDDKQEITSVLPSNIGEYQLFEVASAVDFMQFQKVEKWGFEIDLETTLPVSALIQDDVTEKGLVSSQEDTNGSLESKVNDRETEGAFDYEPLNITLDDIQNINLISFEAVDLPADTLLVAGLDFTTSEGIASSLEIVESKIDVSRAPTDQQDTKMVVPPDDTAMFLPARPIIGHATVDSQDVFKMTDSIDVVFYQGGDVEITNFELGVDLLWFFLPSSELTQASNSINDNGDLVLDFGGTGSLTFLGVVSNYDELPIA